MARRPPGFAADVSQQADCQAMVDTAVERYGSVDVLAANAGIFPRPIAEMTVEDFDHVIHTNLRSAFLCTRAVTPVMEKQGFGGIILTSSITRTDHRLPRLVPLRRQQGPASWASCAPRRSNWPTPASPSTR